MKKLFRVFVVVLTVFIAFSMFSCKAILDSLTDIKGSGTASDPYIIMTGAQLRKVGTGEDGLTASKHYKQGTNIIVLGASWTPICDTGSFTGTYDGGNFYIDFTATNSEAMFGTIGATGNVRNLGIKVDTNSSSLTVIGGLAKTNNGTIEQCYVTGSITNHNGALGVGGLAGSNSGVIRNCYTNVEISITGSGSNSPMAAGLVRQNTGLIEYCYTVGPVSISDGFNNCNAGGLAADNRGASAIIRYSVAANPSLINPNGNQFMIGRVTAGSYLGATTPNNYAKSDMVLTYNTAGGTVNFSDSHQGTAVTSDLIKGAGSSTWWSTTSPGPGFSGSVWLFGDSKYPELRNVAGQTVND